MEPTVSIRGGALRGVRSGNVLHYRNIPYAEAQRFGAPQAAPAWHGVRDATRHGPICPQSPSPLEVAMGTPSAATQDEACLTLSVSAPAASAAPRPVMLWLHGGAYAVGAGSYDWYQPDALVDEGDVVVVNVNYRVGVFGYLRMPGIAPGNLGLLDQIAALHWVRDNIAAVGGDADQVTLFGESAGAHSIVALMSTPEARGLFRRAIAQSPHIGLGFTRQTQAERVARTFQDLLGDVDPRVASVAELLAAQDAMQVKLAGPRGFNSAPVFGPIAGVAPLPQPARADATKAVVLGDIDLIIGTTHDEMRAFFEINPNIARLRRVALIGSAAFGALTSAVTQRVFTMPARRLADAQARSGSAGVYLYAFDWAPPSSPFGACHTIELPFVFGGDAWRHAPMLGHAPRETIDRLGREIRGAWTRFARTGNPNADGGPTWPKHQPHAKPGRRFS